MRLDYSMDMQIYFQIGDPMEHSCAAFVHNAMFAYVNQNAICMPMKVKRGELPQFIEIAKQFNSPGFDITTPHKTDIIQYLDECDSVSKAFRCVNHVKIENGRLIGIGLDGIGMGMMLENAVGKDGFSERKALVIGAGAVAGAIAADLCTRGMKNFVIVNRTPDKARYIADMLKEMFGASAVCGPLEAAFLQSQAKEATLALQCTSMRGETLGDVRLGDFVPLLPKDCVAADVLYPDTPFLQEAAKCGLTALCGKGMLFAQELALMKFRYGLELPQEALKEVEKAMEIAVLLHQLKENSAL